MSDKLKDKESLVFKVLAERDGKLLSAIAGMNCYWRHRDNSDVAKFFIEYKLNTTVLPNVGTKLLAFTNLEDAKHFTLEVDGSNRHIYLCRAGNPQPLNSIPHPGDLIHSHTMFSNVLRKWHEVTSQPEQWHGKSLYNTIGADWLVPIAKLEMPL